MSAPKFTPGPWGPDLQDWREIRAENGDGQAICTVHSPPNTTGRDDSRLICAAPEMRELLTRFLVVYGSTHQQIKVSKEASALLARIDGDDDV